MCSSVKELPLLLTSFILLAAISCNEQTKNPITAANNLINLKRGELVSCGPADRQYGAVAFETSCSQKVKKDFDLALALLHSFEYDEAEKVFARIIDEEPDCAMAYWGIAMANYHPLWAPPSQPELQKGAQAIAIAESLEKTKRESGYIKATWRFFPGLEKS